MKKKSVLIFLFFLFITKNINAQWTLQTSGVTQDLWSVFFVDSNTGFALGDYGLFMKTTDGGENWTGDTIPVPVLLSSVYFFDANNGYIVGWNGTILRTTDGGTTWTNQTSGTSHDLWSVYFTDFNTGYIVGDSATILKTVNGGISWIPQTCQTMEPLHSIRFTNANTGYIAGWNGTILKTTNGGSNWTLQTSGSINSLSSIFFVDENNGYIAEPYSILKTTDGGTTWASHENGIPESFILFSICFTDINTGYAMGNNCTGSPLYITTDGGLNWEDQMSPLYFESTTALLSVFFVNPNIGYTVGTGGVIMKYNNGSTKVNEQIKSEFSIYPNPASEMVTIRMEEENNYQIQITTIDGRILTTSKMAGTYGVMDISSFSKGVYLVRITSGTKAIVKKLIVK